MLSIRELTELLMRADRLGLTTYKTGQAAAWKEVLDAHYPELDLRLATEAVQLLAANLEAAPPRGILPAGLIRKAREIVGNRVARVPVELPAGLTVAEEHAWIRAWTYAAGRGADRIAARAHAENETGLRGLLETGPLVNKQTQLNKFKAQFGKKN